MDSLLPVAAWLRLARSDKGFVATSDSMRQFFAESSGVVPYTEALAALWRQHCDARRATKDENVAALLLVLAHVGRLERELASKILLCDRDDISDDLKVLAGAVDRWCACDVPPSSSSALWIQLLRVTVATLASRVIGSLEEKRLGRFQEHLKACGVQELASSGDEGKSEEAMIWNEFIALDFCLETSALTRTKDGRRNIQRLRVINAQQQSCLVARHFPDENQGSAGEACALDPLWHAAASFATCCPQTSDPVQGVKIEDDVPYQVFCDESRLVNCLRDGSDPSPLESTAIAQEEPATGHVPPVEVIEAFLPTEIDFIDDQMRELEIIRDVSVLRVRVASLLGLQLRRGSTLQASDRSSQWEQAIRKTINSLTSAVSEAEATLQLLRLAAMHPEAFVEILMNSALATTQHHNFFGRLVLECPLLMDWTGTSKSEDPDVQKSSIAITALRQAVYRVASQQNTAVSIEKSPAVRFLLLLSMPSRRQSASKDAALNDAVFTPDAALRLIFWPAVKLCANTTHASPTSRVFSLMRFFLEKVHTAGSACVSSDTLRDTMEMVASAYATAVSDSAEHEELQDSMLLVTDALLRARSSASKWPLTSVWDSCIDIRMHSLLATHAMMASAFRGYESGDLAADELLRSIDQQLWRLVWACGQSENGVSTDERHSVLQKIGEREFVEGNLTVSGHHVIQNRVSEMLRSSGSGVFDRIVRTIDRFILPGPGVSHYTNYLQLMEYALRCWSVSAFSSASRGSLSVIRMLVRTVALIDHAIGSAEANPLALTRCLEATGLLYSWLQSHPPDPATVSATDRIEVVAMRVLFQLRQCLLDGRSDFTLMQEEKTIRSSVASLLVSTRLIENESVVSFLRSNTRSTVP